MMRLRLFSRDDPSRQIDSRTLAEGALTIGRGTTADWVVEDPERGLSRQHLTIAVRDGMPTLRDTSTNGVFLGQPRQRVERDRATSFSPGEAVHFGAYVLIAEQERAEAGARAPAERRDAIPAPSAGASPFGAPAGVARDDRPGATSPNPFGSALKPDPVALEEAPGDGVDAWEQRRAFKAGDWQPTAPHRRPDHSEMIGTPQQWAEPAPVQREAGLGFDAPFVSPILQAPDAAGDAAAMRIPSDWDASPEAGGDVDGPPAPIVPPAPAASSDPILPPDPPPAERQAPADDRPRADDAPLFESFCAGARLSPDQFAGEDRERLMERLGAIYRQAILGMADLMAGRTALKDDFRMVRTSIRADGNNPFKWVPPQRIAVELLRSEDGSGYTTGEHALGEALHDVKAHQLCILSGMRAALSATFDLLAPSAIEGRLAGRGFVIPGQKSAVAWTEYVELFAALRREADDDAEGPINRAFRDAYQAQAEQLDGKAARQ